MNKPEAPPSPRDLIVRTLRTKSAMKQDVFKATTDLFAQLKIALQEMATDLEQEVTRLRSKMG